jgi:hypothetical protein
MDSTGIPISVFRYSDYCKAFAVITNLHSINHLFVKVTFFTGSADFDLSTRTFHYDSNNPCVGQSLAWSL